jgi:hypothetical protein
MSIERGAETLRRSGWGSTGRATSSVRRKGFLMIGMTSELRYLLSNIVWAERCGHGAGRMSLCDSRCWGRYVDSGIIDQLGEGLKMQDGMKCKEDQGDSGCSSLGLLRRKVTRIMMRSTASWSP